MCPAAKNSTFLSHSRGFSQRGFNLPSVNIRFNRPTFRR